jgi:hypothetical protein
VDAEIEALRAEMALERNLKADAIHACALANIRAELLEDALRQIAEWPDGGNRYGQENIKRFAKAAIAEAEASDVHAENKRLREELSKMRAEPSDEEIDAIVSKHFQLPGNVSGAYAVITEVLWSERMQRMAEDAARYRWLRDPCSGAERVIFYCRGDYGRGLMSSAMLDAAIDAAMEGENERD